MRYLFIEIKTNKIVAVHEGDVLTFLLTNNEEKLDVEVDGAIRVYGLRKDAIDVYSYESQIPDLTGLRKELGTVDDEVTGEKTMRYESYTLDDLDGTQVKIRKVVGKSELDEILEKEVPTTIDLQRALEILRDK